ncbi:MAG TPA: plastocyanin/azurin family copper-binding protein [Acidimicrobiia bacterium]|jgi:plastocyanin|nr:plastocyanin/azurin family copper-binding protein [Acidimicrobiia bacterium]
MRKGMWLAAAFVVLLSGATVLWGPTVQAADNRVAMKDQLKYDPADITVPVNSAVVFYNAGSIQHDAKAEDGSFDTPLLDPGNEKAVTFTKPGDFKYYCSVEGHRSAGMTGVVHVTTGGSTPTTAATTTTTAASTATTAATVPGQAATTTTTAKAAAGASSTTTTTAAANGTTTTTLASSAPPAGAGETTTTTAAAPAGGEEAAADHNADGGSHNKKHEKNSPIGIAFASVSTLLLAAIAGKLLASKL